jgi:hypothetical protein
VQSLFESKGIERLSALPVIERIVRVEPIALCVHFEIREFRRLDEKLLLKPESRDELDFVVVQIELAAVQISVHVGVGQEDFRRAAFNDDVEDF